MWLDPTDADWKEDDEQRGGFRARNVWTNLRLRGHKRKQAAFPTRSKLTSTHSATVTEKPQTSLPALCQVLGVNWQHCCLSSSSWSDFFFFPRTFSDNTSVTLVTARLPRSSTSDPFQTWNTQHFWLHPPVFLHVLNVHIKKPEWKHCLNTKSIKAKSNKVQWKQT